MDGEVAKQFQRMLGKQGFTFKLGSKVTGVTKAKKGASVTFEPVNPAKGSGDAETVEADVVLIATGRKPYTEGLGLKEAGVDMDERGRVKTDGHLCTNVPGIYLAGTVAAGIQQRYTLFIENSHEHAGKIARAITGRWPAQLGDVPARNYHLAFEQIEAN